MAPPEGEGFAAAKGGDQKFNVILKRQCKTVGMPDLSCRDLNKLLLDLLFPIQCLNCRAYGKIVCDSCVGIIKIFKHFSGEDSVLYVCAYKNKLIKKIVYGLKYYGIFELAAVIAELMHKFLILNAIDFGPEWRIMPVPMHPWKKRKRSFNQSELIANELSKRLNIVYCEFLAKTVSTIPQTKLPRWQRLQNLANAFECKIPLNNQKILIVDDIMTTGSTFYQCSVALQKAGASQIKFLAFANND